MPKQSLNIGNLVVLFLIGLMIIITAALLFDRRGLRLYPVTPAHAHDIATAKTPDEKRVFEFYTTWYRMPERTMSCCNMTDCHIAQVKREGGQWYFLDTLYQHPAQWRSIPPDRIEQNAIDPRESPDGNSHVCFNAMYVLCVVLGSGQ